MNRLQPQTTYTPQQIDEAIQVFRLSPYLAPLRPELIRLVNALTPNPAPGYEAETAQLWDYFNRILSDPNFSYEKFWANQ